MFINPREMLESRHIVFVSSHFPTTVEYAQKTRESFREYTARHGYGYFYDEEPAESSETHTRHYQRCWSLQKAKWYFPDAQWFVWIDSDIFVNPSQQHLVVQDLLDLEDTRMLYHFFHEHPFYYPINTGVKFVRAEAISYEVEAYRLKDTPPWNEFPYEQKCMYEYTIPKIPGQSTIHDPYVLNCLAMAHWEHMEKALFIHLCGLNEEQRNDIMGREDDRLEYIKRKYIFEESSTRH